MTVLAGQDSHRLFVRLPGLRPDPQQLTVDLTLRHARAVAVVNLQLEELQKIQEAVIVTQRLISAVVKLSVSVCNTTMCSVLSKTRKVFGCVRSKHICADSLNLWSDFSFTITNICRAAAANTN